MFLVAVKYFISFPPVSARQFVSSGVAVNKVDLVGSIAGLA